MALQLAIDPNAPQAARLLPESFWIPFRKPPRAEDLVLNEQARAWAQALPRHARADNLVRLYARIANKLALLWPDPEACSAYFDDLLIDRRGGRKGFPPEVGKELVALRVHHMALYPTQCQPWGFTN
jgi:hypothetical protein